MQKLLFQSGSYPVLSGKVVIETVYDLVCVCYVLCGHAVQLQIEEITRRLRTGELGIPTNPADRSVRVCSGSCFN